MWERPSEHPSIQHCAFWCKTFCKENDLTAHVSFVGCVLVYIIYCISITVSLILACVVSSGFSGLSPCMDTQFLISCYIYLYLITTQKFQEEKRSDAVTSVKPFAHQSSSVIMPIFPHGQKERHSTVPPCGRRVIPHNHIVNHSSFCKSVHVYISFQVKWEERNIIVIS